MLPKQYIADELAKIFNYHNLADSDTSYGLALTTKQDPFVDIHPIHAPADLSVAQRAIAELGKTATTHKLPLPGPGGQHTSLYLWRIPLDMRTSNFVLWSVSRNSTVGWEPFFPLSFTELGQLCSAYLNSCYSNGDLHYLIGSAFESGASRLALSLIQRLTHVDSVLLWMYHPDGHYFQAHTIVGAAEGGHVTPTGKGIVGQLSPTNRHIAVNYEQPDALKPFHPELFRREGWNRVQYAAICSEGTLLGAIGFYWRKANEAEFLKFGEAMRIAALASIFVSKEHAELTLKARLDSLERLIIRLTPAEALVGFLHDTQRSLRDATTAMVSAAVLLDRSSNPASKAVAARLSSSADFVNSCMNRMARLALLDEKAQNHRRIDLRLLLQKMRLLLESYSAVKVSVETGAAEVWIRGDRLSIERVILNLVANAVYWTEAKLHGERAVRIRLHRSQGSAVVEVEDSGLGVGPEVRDRIFDKFVSGRPDGGTGMGLYMVKDIVESHNGEVSFFSNHRGQGTTFRLKFPLLERT